MQQQPIKGPQLTVDQQAAADAFFLFLMSEATTFVISGRAGVGKTFLMSHLCRRVMQDYEDACVMMNITKEYDSLVFTATTNKAAEVLEKSLGLPVQTIHSYLSLKVTEDFKTGKTFLQKTDAHKVRDRQIVFIDECSMIDSDLFQTIKASFTNSKIIFVGDHAQMAPVSEPLSPVFASVEPENFVFLSQPVRNAGTPALVALCTQLRATVETGYFNPIKEVPGVIDYLNDTTMPLMLHKYFKDPDPSARVLCYTNTRVESYNEFIREDVRAQPSEFQVGDILVVAQNHTTLGSKPITLNVEREVRVLRVGPTLEDHNYADVFSDKQPIFYRDITVSSLNPGSMEITVRVATDKDKVAAGVKAYGKRKDWSSYFNLKGAYADLRDKAACTVYKSQGSTYEAVFVDLGNIGTSYDPEQVARMLFVAVSRATTRVFLYGQLPSRYRGK